MNIRIIAPGKLKEQWLQLASSEYQKRISGYSKIEIIEVTDSPDYLPLDKALDQEGKAILSKIKPGEIVWVLDLHGKEMTSEAFSEEMIKAIDIGGASITFVIGGSRGLSPEVINRASRRVCFGKITMTHLMTRIILLEQIYRAFKIANNEKYHK